MHFKNAQSVILVIVLPVVILGGVVTLLAVGWGSTSQDNLSLPPSIIFSPTTPPKPFGQILLDTLFIGLKKGSTCRDAESIAASIGGKVAKCREYTTDNSFVVIEIPARKTEEELNSFIEKLRASRNPLIEGVSSVTRTDLWHLR